MAEAEPTLHGEQPRFELGFRELGPGTWAWQQPTWSDPERLVVTLSTERFRREGGEGHLGGLGRTRAILAMGRLKSVLERPR